MSSREASAKILRYVLAWRFPGIAAGQWGLQTQGARSKRVCRASEEHEGKMDFE
jgi:hypothetical protein